MPALGPRSLRILGTGAALPAEAVTSAALDERLGLPAGTVEERTGVRVRYVEKGTAAALGARAARQALDAAGCTLDEVDLLVAASGTPDQPLPYNAALLHEELAPGHPLPSFDVNSSCLSFLVALDLAATMLHVGQHRRILVVSSDLASVGLDFTDLGASAIFGDGAAAVVLGPGEDTGSALLSSAFATFSSGAHACEIRGGGSRWAPDRVAGEGDYADWCRFEMDGGAALRLAVRHLPGLVTRVLEEAGTGLDDLAVVVPHQASHLGLAWLRQHLGTAGERLVDVYAGQGNQVGASLPSALHAAVADGRLARGDRALLLGTGAGISMGGLVLCF